MAKAILFVLLTQAPGQHRMFPFIMKLPVQSGWSPSKNCMWASSIQVKQVYVLM